MVEVVATDEFREWFVALDDADANAVDRYVGLLEDKGVSLQFPYCSERRGAQFALRELRVQSRGTPLRVLYAFDPIRQAVLLRGGDKTGNMRWYDEMIPRADALFRQYLAEQATGEHDDE